STATTPRLEGFDSAFVKEVVRGVARRQDDVDVVDDVTDRLELDCLPTERAGNPIGSVERSRGEVDRSDALVAQEPEGDLAHAARAHEQHAAAGQVAQQLGSRRYGRMAGGDRVTSEFRLVAGAASRPDGAVEDDLESDFHDAGRACASQSPFDLTTPPCLTRAP